MCQLAGHVYGGSSQLSWDDCMTAFSALSKFCMDGWDNIFTGADSRFAPSQRETSLQSNAASHCLSANLELALH